MNARTWRLLAAYAILAVYAVLLASAGEAWIVPREAALGWQFSTAVTHFGARMLVAAVIAAVTVLFGRWYCSVLCPAGAAQDLFTRVGRRLKLLRLRHARGTPPLFLLLWLTLFAVMLGNVAVGNFLDPISVFGRFVRPLGALAGVGAAGFGVVVPFAAAALFLVVLPLFRGRWFCDRLCPVGAALAVAGSLPGKRVAIAPDKCVGCGKCAGVCPVRCIDAADKRIDAGRCVACLDCVGACGFGAIAYGNPRPAERRGFLHWLTAAVAAHFVFVRELAGRRGVFATAAGAEPAVTPPGSTGNIRHKQRCVGCQACVLSCPVGIIRAKRSAKGRPVLDFDHGYCQYNCVSCAASCPTGAIAPLGPGEKQRVRLARTELLSERCVVILRGTECGACAEVCPTHAVVMRAPEGGGPTEPDFDAEYCIGCGACYHVCPAEPRAFVVAGLDRHEVAEGVRPTEPEGEPPVRETPELTDFPF